MTRQRIWQRLSPLVVTCCLAFTAVACKKSVEEEVDPAEAPVETEEQAREVAAHFEGLFRHQDSIHGMEVVTELELREDRLVQRRNALTALDAACETEANSRRRMTFRCRDEGETASTWPLEIDEEGKLFHRAQPEMRYERVELETP